MNLELVSANFDPSPQKPNDIIKLSPILLFWMGKCIASLAYVRKTFAKKIVLQECFIYSN